MTTYRPDVDGLRAVAVLAVIGSHLKVPGMIGGFVGVDVFFVISGFLIGSLVEGEVRESRFSLADFYERRFRRIFPALFAMLAGTTALALVFALPTQLETYAKSLIATALSVSNIFFYTDAGYFQAQQASYPLLHTWSLGVEEQFYLLFPPLVLAVSRAPARWRVPIWAAVAALSFAVSAYGAIHWPIASFYLLHSRAWELLLGYALVLVPLPWLKRAGLRNAAGLAGLGAIAASVVAYWEAMPFPGLAALVPCGGAALVIAAGSHGRHWAGRALSVKPTVTIGLVSYSLYLWHWPLISFAEHGFDFDIRRWPVRIAILLLSLAIAYASWRWIERPFRRRQRFTRRTIFAGAGISAAAACVAGGVALAGAGLPGRYPAEVVRLASELDVDTDALYRRGTCFITTGNTFADFRRDLCLARRPGRPAVLLVGNSHGAHLSYGLRQRFPGVDILQATASGCRPLVGTGPSRPPRCGRLRDYVFDEWLPAHRVDALLLSVSWEARDVGAIRRTLAWAKARGIPVIVSGPVPMYDQALPELLARAALAGDPALPARHARKGRAQLDVAIGAAAREAGATYVSPWRLLCGAGPCRTLTPEGMPMQHDVAHLSPEGSRYVAQIFDAPFRRLSAAR